MKKRKVQIIKNWQKQPDGSYNSVEKIDPKAKRVICVLPSEVKLYTDIELPMLDPRNANKPPLFGLSNPIKRC